MYERYTVEARRAVLWAKEYVLMHGHDEIDTGHILLGLTSESYFDAAVVLEGIGVDLGVLRDRVQAEIGQGYGTPQGHIPFTPQAKDLLSSQAENQAIRIGYHEVSTAHILLAMLSQHRIAEVSGAAVLESLGVDEDKIRSWLV